jgi:hypothetical protein
VGKPSISYRRVDREDNIVKSIAIASYKDKPIRRAGGLQARGAYKEVLSLAFG